MPGRASSRLWSVSSCVVLLIAILLAWTWSARDSNEASAVLAPGFRNVLVLTAHPDDETMFFGPVILHLIAAGIQVHGLCLSTGNADGLGRIREDELRRAYSVLGVPPSRVTIVDNPLLQDGMSVDWDPHLVLSHTFEVSLAHNVDSILTFDSAGVSKHANHIALHDALNNATRFASVLQRKYQERSELKIEHMQEGTSTRPSVWVLRTPPLWQKFLGLPMALTSHSHRLTRRKGVLGRQTTQPMEGRPSARELQFLSSPSQYLRTLRAMRAHSSQLVWFRYLYVLFSTLMYASSIQQLLPSS
ncbi:N-acetylglucosaminyl-phosphatidylinositol de-N-acetylase [Tilletia horrida]|nr:N-acetylglucosaminyl-phosphatidylinositol de-N-acetylase [Tilletia horrida]